MLKKFLMSFLKQVLMLIKRFLDGNRDMYLDMIYLLKVYI